MDRARSELNALAATVLRGAAPDEKVMLSWPLVAGTAIAQRSKAVAFSDGVLQVEVPDRAYQAELAGYTPHYLHQLSAASGEKVESIRFVLANERSR